MQKASFEEENRRRFDNGEAPHKRLKQTVLPFVSKNSIPAQVKDRVVGGVCHTLVAGCWNHVGLTILHRNQET